MNCSIKHRAALRLDEFPRTNCTCYYYQLFQFSYNNNNRTDLTCIK